MSKNINEILTAMGSGGCIVSSSECSRMEISWADAEGRFYVDDGGLGYVVRTKPWLWLAQTAIKAYNRSLMHPENEEQWKADVLKIVDDVAAKVQHIDFETDARGGWEWACEQIGEDLAIHFASPE